MRGASAAAIAALRERRARAVEQLEETAEALERYPGRAHLYRRDQLAELIAELDSMLARYGGSGDA